MRLPAFSHHADSLFALFGMTFVVFGWFLLALALAGIFSPPLVALGALLTALLALLILTRLFGLAPRDFRLAIFAACALAALVAHFTVPTIFSGRDQGSLSEAAIRLSQNHELPFATPSSDAFFRLHEPGTALNFPGFAYTAGGDLITQFPLGYTAWLAGFYALFGLAGLTAGNALLLCLSLLTLYALLRLFVAPFYAGFGFALAACSFLPIWFAKYTLTENLALFLFLSLAYHLALFRNHGKFITYAGVLLTGSLLAFTRIEGFAILALALLVLAFTPATRAIWKTYPVKSLVLPGLLFAFVLLRDFLMNLPFYKMIGRSLFRFLGISGGLSGSLDATAGTPAGLGSVFFVYGLLVLFAVGGFGLLVILKEKRSALLLPALLAAPTFLYFVAPNITLDSPWMLRRYLFSVFPALLFSAVAGLALLFDRERVLPVPRPRGKRLLFVSAVFLGLILLELPAWHAGLATIENPALLGQIRTFADQFTERDLILVDRFATGDGFAMLTGPTQTLFHREAVYFFNPDDLAALDTSRFDRVFLLVPTGDTGRYAAAFGKRLVFRQSVAFTLDETDSRPSESAFPSLPRPVTSETLDTLYQIY